MHLYISLLLWRTQKDFYKLKDPEINTDLRQRYWQHASIKSSDCFSNPSKLTYSLNSFNVVGGLEGPNVSRLSWQTYRPSTLRGK